MTFQVTFHIQKQEKFVVHVNGIFSMLIFIYSFLVLYYI